MSAQSRRLIHGILLSVPGIVGLMLVINSCSDMGNQAAVQQQPPGGSGPVSYASQVQPIFTANCTNRGCHPGGGAPFSLLASVSYTNLVNAPASIACSGVTLQRVKPSFPDSSALVLRLAGSCGLQMPLGFSALSAGDQILIRTWITQGALNN